MFKNMGGNTPGGNFLGGNFPGGSFPDTVLTMIFKIMTKENNAAVLILLTDANFKNPIDDSIPLRNSNFEKKIFYC